ncbi:MAG: glycosyltransferase, partial [Dolichospermum sp.]
FHLGLRAFAQANLPNTEYWIVGDGPQWHQLQTLASHLGIAKKVKFWGRLPREKALDLLKDCHLLIHPSLHDSGGWVCMEAMAAGRPVICLDLGGPAVQVTEETGFKIAADEPYQVVRDLAAAMIYLVQNPELIVSMGQAGRKLVNENYS